MHPGSHSEPDMADIVYLGLALASFGIFALAVFFCERL
jgi:hypothetical protein